MVPRKATSIGIVTNKSVVVTSWMLGSFLGLGGPPRSRACIDGVRMWAENGVEGERAAIRAAAWREVESLETRMEPTLPGRPAM
jgi:hypothetical protein